MTGSTGPASGDNKENSALTKVLGIESKQDFLKPNNFVEDIDLKEEIKELKFLNTKCLLELSIYTKANELASTKDQDDYHEELQQKLQKLEESQKALLEEKESMIAISNFRIRSVKNDLSKKIKKIEELDAECGKLESSATDCKQKYEEIASKLKDEIGSRKRERDELMEVIKSRDEQCDELEKKNRTQKNTIEKLNDEVTCLLRLRSESQGFTKNS